jgi:hypothetical protein
VSTADRRLLAREATISTAIAAALAAFLLWATPPGIDWAAHAYQRTFLLQHGFEMWNNFWYAGRYSFVTYSLIYYPLAALLGIKVLALASIASAAAAFSIVVFREWGPVSVVSSRSFAVLWVGIIGAAAFPLRAIYFDKTASANLLHASSAATEPGHRRVMHIEYACEPLPAGLEWFERCV